ncbi:MAG: glycoside hydrolase family 38 C-terminal domain-containing protein [Phycisphaeraceae bacterium]
MRYGFSLPLEIPALGWRSISLKQSSRKWIPSDPSKSLVIDGQTLENPSLRAVVQADGTIELTHLETGQAYSRLLALEDGADIGDGWRYVAPANDSLSVSGGARTSVRVLDEGPYLGRLETRCQLDVPARYDGATQARSAQMVSLEVIHRVALRRDADWLEVETEVRNNACDHRLRVLIPTGATADAYWCDSPFDVFQRSIKLAEDHATWREPELESKPQQSWTAACDQQRGLAVISRGLRETAVLDRPDRAIALTLLRATQKTVFTDGEPGGQLAGTHTFHYWIQPIAKRPDPSSLHDLATLLNAGVRSVSLLPGMIERSRVGRQAMPALPPTAGSLGITGPACLTAMRFKGDHMEIRLFNPLDTSCEAGLRPHASSPIRFSPGQSRIISLAGEELGPPSEVSGGLLVTLGPKQVLTLRIATERVDSA